MTHCRENYYLLQCKRTCVRLLDALRRRPESAVRLGGQNYVLGVLRIFQRHFALKARTRSAPREVYYRYVRPRALRVSFVSTRRAHFANLAGRGLSMHAAAL
jgi:hypothetical protein